MLAAGQRATGRNISLPPAHPLGRPRGAHRGSVGGPPAASPRNRPGCEIRSRIFSTNCTVRTKNASKPDYINHCVWFIRFFFSFLSSRQHLSYRIRERNWKSLVTYTRFPFNFSRTCSSGPSRLLESEFFPFVSEGFPSRSNVNDPDSLLARDILFSLFLFLLLFFT